MMYNHTKRFMKFQGIDIDSDQINLPAGSFSGGKNAVILSEDRHIETRNGFKRVQELKGFNGIAVLDTTNILGITGRYIVGFGNDVNIDHPFPVILSYEEIKFTNPSADTYYLSIYYNETSSVFKLLLVENSTNVLDIDITSLTVADIKTQVEANSSLLVTVGDNASSVSATYLNVLTSYRIIPNDVLTEDYCVYKVANNSLGTLFSMSHYRSLIGQNKYINVSTTNLNGVLYISQFNELAVGDTTSTIMKYDGQRFYRSGFHRPPDTGIQSLVSTTPVTDDVRGYASFSFSLTGTYKYAYTFINIDKTGQITESDITFSSTVTPSSQVVKCFNGRLSFHSAGGLSYNTSNAIVNGTQSSVLTINVDSGHTMAVGDIAYFWDQSRTKFIQREVTATTSTSITVSSTAIDVLNDTGGAIGLIYDNAVISNNLRVGIWRTKNGGENDYYLVEEIPFDNVSSGWFYYDDKQDDNLGAEYIRPVKERTQPPSGKYLCKFNDQLIVSGNSLNPRRVYFSDIDGPEYFPSSNAFDVELDVTGISQCGEVLAVFTKNSVYIVSGTLDDGNFRVDKIASNVGCVSHASIQEVEEGLVFFLSDKGPYYLQNGRKVAPLGESQDQTLSKISPFFTKSYSGNSRPAFTRSVSTILRQSKLYILHIPFEDVTRPTFGNSDSTTWIFDYAKGVWYPNWSNLNMSGGVIDYNDNILYVSRSHNGSPDIIFSNIISYTSREQKNRGYYGYADHDQPIDFEVRFHNEHLGEPSIFKKFLRINFYSLFQRLSSIMRFNVKTYLDYDDTKISTNDTLTFTTQKNIKMKLKSDHGRAMKLVIDSQRYHEPVSLTGYEIEVAAPFKDFKE